MRRCLCADSQFLQAADTAIVAESALVALYGCNITDSGAVGIHTENLGRKDRDTTYYARVRVQDCAFDNNSADVLLWEEAPLYADMPKKEFKVHKYSQGKIYPLARTGGIFADLTNDSSSFQALQRVRLCCSETSLHAHSLASYRDRWQEGLPEGGTATPHSLAVSLAIISNPRSATSACAFAHTMATSFTDVHYTSACLLACSHASSSASYLQRAGKAPHNEA